MRAFQALLLAAVLATPAAAVAEPKVLSVGQAVQSGTTAYVLHADKIGRDFLVEVTWPITPILPGQKLPAIYAVDGGFGLLGPMSTMIIAGGGMAPAFVVSVGYPNPTASSLGPRNTDLTYNRFRNPQTGREDGGGAAAYEAFLVEEVRPFLEARYPIDPAKAYLVGHSGGGNFAANILVERPEQFAGYVIGGLPISMAPDLVDKARAVAPRGAGRRVFLFYTPGDLKSGLRSNEFTAALTGPDSRFEVRETVYQTQNHNSSYAAFPVDALPFILPPPAPSIPPPAARVVEVDAKTLDRYVGLYQVRPGATVAVMRSGQRLFVKVGEESPRELFARSPREFEARGTDTQLAFDGGGRAAQVALRLRGVEMTGRRVAGATPVMPFVAGPAAALAAPIAVASTILDAYVGAYRLDDGRMLTFTRDGARLFGQLDKGAFIELAAETERRFNALGAPATVTFDAPTGGKAQGLTVRLNTINLTGRRVN